MRLNTSWHRAHMVLASSRPDFDFSSRPINMFS